MEMGCNVWSFFIWNPAKGVETQERAHTHGKTTNSGRKGASNKKPTWVERKVRTRRKRWHTRVQTLSSLVRTSTSYHSGKEPFSPMFGQLGAVRGLLFLRSHCKKKKRVKELALWRCQSVVNNTLLTFYERKRHNCPLPFFPNYITSLPQKLGRAKKE